MCPKAFDQSRWALSSASVERPISQHGRRPSLFGPSSVGEAKAIAEEVLGALFAYDRDHGADLVSTLRIFLQCNRSWTRASRQLFVHKQTLIYRIQRIEDLTKRKLTMTGDVAELWLALRAYDIVGVSDVGPAQPTLEPLLARNGA